MNEKISVIIPLFNKEHEIKRAVDSVLSQTIQPFEIIVVDDHSSDKGPVIVRSYSDPRIILVEQEHRGVSYTRNHGVHCATSNYIAFLDADDEWTPNHLETISSLIEKYPSAGMYATAYIIQTKEGKTQSPIIKHIPDPPWEGLIPDYFKCLAFGNLPVNATNVVIYKNFFLDSGGFPEGYWWGEDVDLFGKIALKYPVAFSWRLGAIYHWDAKNRTCDTFMNTKTLEIEDEPFIKTARKYLERNEVPLDLIESLQEYVAKREIIWAYRYINTGRFDKAKALLKHCKTQWFKEEKERFLRYVYWISIITTFGRYKRKILS